MAGRPKRNADLAILNNILPKQGNAIFEAVADGTPLRRIAENNAIGLWALATWLEDPARIESYKRARARAASRLAEQTIEIADGPEKAAVTGATDAPAESDVGRDKLRIQSRQWLASRWDRETYGEQKGPQVTINLATLHLDALRRKPITIDAQPDRTAPVDQSPAQGNSESSARIGQLPDRTASDSTEQ